MSNSNFNYTDLIFFEHKRIKNAQRKRNSDPSTWSWALKNSQKSIDTRVKYWRRKGKPKNNLVAPRTWKDSIYKEYTALNNKFKSHMGKEVTFESLCLKEYTRLCAYYYNRNLSLDRKYLARNEAQKKWLKVTTKWASYLGEQRQDGRWKQFLYYQTQYLKSRLKPSSRVIKNRGKSLGWPESLKTYRSIINQKQKRYGENNFESHLEKCRGYLVNQERKRNEKRNKV